MTIDFIIKIRDSTIQSFGYVSMHALDKIGMFASSCDIWASIHVLFFDIFMKCYKSLLYLENYHMSSICSLCQWYAPITFPRLYEQNVLRTIWHCNSAFKQNMLLFHLVSLLCILIPYLFETCPLYYGYVSHLLSFICSPRCYINFSG